MLHFHLSAEPLVRDVVFLRPLLSHKSLSDALDFHGSRLTSAIAECEVREGRLPSARTPARGSHPMRRALPPITPPQSPLFGRRLRTGHGLRALGGTACTVCCNLLHTL